MPPKSNLLRISRYDAENSFILLRATLSEDSTSLTLQATENTTAYLHTLPVTDLPTLKAKPYKGTPEDLTNLLLSGLLDPTNTSTIFTAALSPTACSLTIRRHVGTIKQKIASLTLPTHDPETAGIDLFEWALQALSLREEVALKTDSEAVVLGEREREVAELRRAVEELTRAKGAHEAGLLARFGKVLGEKKRRVRELEREVEELRGGMAGMEIKSEDEELVEVKPEVKEEEEEPVSTRGKRTATRGRGRGRGKAAVPRKGVKRTSSKMEPSSTASESDDPPVTRAKASQMDVDRDPEATDSDATASDPESDTRSTEDEMVENAAASDDDGGRDKVDEVIRKRQDAVGAATLGSDARARWEALKGGSGTPVVRAEGLEVKPLDSEKDAPVETSAFGEEMDEDTDDDDDEL